MLNLYWRLRHRLEFLKPKNLRSDRSVIIRQYEKRLGVKPDLEHPETYTEKIQWLKLHYRPEILTTLADKCLAREYIKERVGEEYLVPLVFCTDNVYDIRPEKLPDYPVIIKTNHDSGGGIFVFDKNRVSYKDIRKKLVDRLRKNYYYPKREWQYKNIKPKIIIEKLLMDENGNIPFDYKFFCFNGKVEFLQIDIGRFSEHKRFYVDANEWLNINYLFKDNLASYNSELIEKPKNFKEMIFIAEKLSKGFPHMRVDLYNNSNKIYIGEMTFCDGAGYSQMMDTYNRKIGKQISLNGLW